MRRDLGDTGDGKGGIGGRRGGLTRPIRDLEAGCTWLRSPGRTTLRSIYPGTSSDLLRCQYGPYTPRLCPSPTTPKSHTQIIRTGKRHTVLRIRPRELIKELLPRHRIPRPTNIQMRALGIPLRAVRHVQRDDLVADEVQARL